MSKKIFINNLNTFVSKQLLEEMRNDQPGEDGEAPADVNQIFGTYIDKDSSQKPVGIKKMLKVSFFKFCNSFLTEVEAPSRHEVLVRVRLDHLRSSLW